MKLFSNDFPLCREEEEFGTDLTCTLRKGLEHLRSLRMQCSCLESCLGNGALESWAKTAESLEGHVPAIERFKFGREGD